MKINIDEKLLKKIVSFLKEYPEIKRAVIFGSRVRGDSSYNSDIDIAIDAESELPTSFFLDMDEIAGLYKVDILIMKKISDENLKNEIEKYGVEIYKAG
ncbi:MAG: nucleotidyltransferase family protein [Brevinematia bacterium]